MKDKKHDSRSAATQHNRRIDHQPFEPRPDDLAALVMVRQQGQDAGQVVGLRADFEHLPVKIRQLAVAATASRKGAAFGQVGLQFFQFRPQRAPCRISAHNRCKAPSSGMPSRTMAASCWLKKANSSYFISQRPVVFWFVGDAFLHERARAILPACVAARRTAIRAPGFAPRKASSTRSHSTSGARP